VTELFESSLSIIILAIIVSVRLVLYLRKRAETRARNQNRPPPLGGIEALEAEGATIENDNDEEDFSAWALSVEAESRDPVPPPVTPVRNTGLFPAVPPPAIPEAAPAPVPILDIWQHPYSGETAPVLIPEPHSAARRTKTGGAFWEKLRDLPPLTQGVILSEILSPPRGL
jgi:hypothetical protein